MDAGVLPRNHWKMAARTRHARSSRNIDPGMVLMQCDGRWCAGSATEDASRHMQCLQRKRNEAGGWQARPACAARAPSLPPPLVETFILFGLPANNATLPRDSKTYPHFILPPPPTHPPDLTSTTHHSTAINNDIINTHQHHQSSTCASPSSSASPRSSRLLPVRLVSSLTHSINSIDNLN